MSLGSEARKKAVRHLLRSHAKERVAAASSAIRHLSNIVLQFGLFARIRRTEATLKQIHHLLQEKIRFGEVRLEHVPETFLKRTVRCLDVVGRAIGQLNLGEQRPFEIRSRLIASRQR